RKIRLVPENVLKKRKASQALRVTQAKEELLQRKERRKEKEPKYKQLEWFLHNSWHQLHDRALEVPDKHSLVFVVCTQRINGVNLLVQRTIARLHLKNIFSGIFMKVGSLNHEKTGFPDLKPVQELILKHRQAKGHLGRFGVICLENLIHETVFPGKDFRVISGFQCPFQLSVPSHTTRWAHLANEMNASISLSGS
ncbi:hypothetical protein FD754_016536, partial [Muntiacus muntjak]